MNINPAVEVLFVVIALLCWVADIAMATHPSCPKGYLFHFKISHQISSSLILCTFTGTAPKEDDGWGSSGSGSGKSGKSGGGSGSGKSGKSGGSSDDDDGSWTDSSHAGCKFVRLLIYEHKPCRRGVVCRYCFAVLGGRHSNGYAS